MTALGPMRGVIVAVAAITIGCARGLVPRPTVPVEHRRTVVNSSDPTDEPPAACYRRAYQSFWWNCLAVKAEDERARCPFVCNGTSAAVEGCGAGGTEAEEMVGDLIRRVGVVNAKNRLRARVSMVDARESIRLYFPSGARTEKD